ncbi:hypothetical protein HLB00_02675 [Ferroplasma acidiphilum]|uniref:DNA-directed RNA polymerase subunit Rpo4 n=3 Tax=Ferroplasma acidiphilum TaxID=74969 RepID=A0A7K4FMY9_9ARCH|nr:hypothetical protein [Ferroplasma acidiphilum]
MLYPENKNWKYRKKNNISTCSSQEVAPMKITYKTNNEVFNMLSNVEERTPSENDTLAYVEKFLKYDKDADLKQLYNDISKVHKLPREAIVKIIDIKPSSTEELMAILNSYNVAADNKVLDSILDILRVL